MQTSLTQIRTRIERSLARANRPLDSCQLIAVSKMQSAAKIHQARAQGLTHFGENKVQEAREKFPAFEDRPDTEVLHLIGPLQSNKVRQAIQHFDVIHCVDRPKLAQAIHRIAGEVGRCPQLLIQVNTGQEAQKAGVMPADLAALVDLMRTLDLPLIGLMCIPPADQAPAPHFAWLAQEAQALGLRELSMGMSQDFEAAAELGATYVRVGSAIFGERMAPSGL